MKRICVLTSAHPVFDVRIFHKECKSLASAGYNVTLVAPCLKSSECDGVRIEAVRARTGRFARATLGVLEVLRSAFRENADIYHFHDPELIPAGLILRLAGKKVIYDVHEDLPNTLSYKNYIPGWIKKPLQYVVDSLERLASRTFSGLVVVTPHIAKRFRKSNRTLAIVANYPLLEEFPDIARSSDSLEDLFIYLGMRITAARGAREIVEAVGQLPASSVRLEMVGEFDPPELREELKSLAGWNRTTPRGLLARGEIASELARARAGLATMHPEPNYVTAFPVKLFEYMAAGVPLIASDFPAYREIVEQAGCGLLVNPLSVDEIATAMSYMVRNPKEAQAMGDRGRAAIQNKYNWKREELKLLALYDRLLTPAGQQIHQEATRKLTS